MIFLLNLTFPINITVNYLKIDNKVFISSHFLFNMLIMQDISFIVFFFCIQFSTPLILIYF